MKIRTYILFLTAIFFLAIADTIIFHYNSWIIFCDWMKLKTEPGLLPYFLSDGWHFSKTMAIVFFILAIISEHMEWKKIFPIVFYLIFLLTLYTLLHIFLFNFLFNNFQFNINP